MADDRTRSIGPSGIRQVVVDQAKQFLATLPSKPPTPTPLRRRLR